MNPGQSIPETFAARSAMVGSAQISGSGSNAAAFNSARPTGRCSWGAAKSASDRSASLIAPLAIRSRYHLAGMVTETPATRARRAPAIARDSPVCPRKGLTATLDASGQTGGIARAARSAAFRFWLPAPRCVSCCVMFASICQDASRMTQPRMSRSNMALA